MMLDDNFVIRSKKYGVKGLLAVLDICFSAANFNAKG